MSRPSFFSSCKATFLWWASPWLGRDKEPSRTMLVITIVLGSYLVSRPVPELVGIVAIIATFGLKPLMAWIATSRSTLSAASQVEVTRSSADVQASIEKHVVQETTVTVQRAEDTGEQVTRSRELDWERLV